MADSIELAVSVCRNLLQAQPRITLPKFSPKFSAEGGKVLLMCIFHLCKFWNKSSLFLGLGFYLPSVQSLEWNKAKDDRGGWPQLQKSLW